VDDGGQLACAAEAVGWMGSVASSVASIVLVLVQNFAGIAILVVVTEGVCGIPLVLTESGSRDVPEVSHVVR